MYYGKLRQDDDGHWYLFPENLLEEWDRLRNILWICGNGLKQVEQVSRASTYQTIKIGELILVVKSH